MGANQSSGAPNAPNAGEVKTSYYELLGVERTATDEEIKKAYRRKALELHPDRNYGDVERTTALFAEVQAAHEVLSDPQERAWYDAHEGDILGGDDAGCGDHYEHNMRVTTADDIARMMRKFNGRVDYSDSPSGFFGFLRETFDTLAREEEAAASWEGLDPVDYPSFGHKDDTYEDVVRDFYNGWSGFSTKKSFSWKDIYRYSEAPDRRVRRLMEKENKRLRDEGIREFNEAVRTLILFVRKRDPRYTPNTQTEEERSKAQRAAAAAQAARAKAAHEAKMQGAVPAWATARDDDEQEEEEESEEEEQFECVACHKTFKSERQFEAHEKSKKHQKAVQALKKMMQKENRHLNLDEDVSSSGVITPMSGDEDGLEAREVNHEVQNDSDDVEHSDEDIARGVHDLGVSDPEDGSRSEDKARPPESEDALEEDDEYAPRSAVENRLNGFDRTTEAAFPDNASPGAELPETSQPTAPKLGKAAQKRAKRAEKMAAADQDEYKSKCSGCNVPFASKTALFQHLKKNPGHAALKPATGKKSGGKKR